MSDIVKYACREQLVNVHGEFSSYRLCPTAKWASNAVHILNHRPVTDNNASSLENGTDVRVCLRTERGSEIRSQVVTGDILVQV